MRGIFIGALAFFAVAAVGMTKAPRSQFTVLLTSFDPFGGSPANNTQAIVADLAKMSATLGDGIDIKTCNLPVVYDKGAKVALDCVSRFNPEVVVSLGEADCSLRLESAATNWDEAKKLPDNAGQTRDGSAIVKGGPERSAFSFPEPEMYCALGSDAASVIVSSSAGSFVCNNTAYLLNQSLVARGLPFVFIHVPNTRCSAGQVNPETNATIIARMLQAAIARIRARAPEPELMPKTQPEALSFLQNLQSSKAPACQLEFAQRLLSSY